MKTLFNVLSIVLKIATIIMAIIGMIMTITMIVLAKPAVYNVYDVVDECDSINPDDEAQDVAIMTEAYRRTLSDPRVKGNKFINTVAHGVGRFTSFVANL